MLERRSEGYPVQYSWMQATKITRTLWIITASVYRYNPSDTANTMYYTGLYINFADKSTVSLVVSASIGNTWNGNANVLKPDVSTAFELAIESKLVKLNMARSETTLDYNTGAQFIGMIYAE